MMLKLGFRVGTWLGIDARQWGDPLPGVVYLGPRPAILRHPTMLTHGP